MKILELMGMDSTKYGGIEKFNVVLVASSTNSYTFVYNSIPQEKRYIYNLQKQNAKVIAIYNYPRIKYILQVLLLVYREKPDIIHFHFDTIKWIISPLIKILFPRIKQLCTYHSEYQTNNFIKKMMTKLFHSCQNRIIAVSEGVKKGLIYKLGEKESNIVVSYLGVSCQTLNSCTKENLEIDRDTFIFTSIGFDCYIKGFDIIAKSVKYILANNNSNFKIVLVGLDQNREIEYRNLIKNLNVEEYFLLLGIRNDIDAILDATDVYLQPSRTEAISLAIMEALHHGIPVIATNVGGIPEVVENKINGFLVPVNDGITLAVAMMKLMNNDLLRKEMGANSKCISSRFDINSGVRRLLSIYDNL